MLQNFPRSSTLSRIPYCVLSFWTLKVVWVETLSYIVFICPYRWFSFFAVWRCGIAFFHIRCGSVAAGTTQAAGWHFYVSVYRHFPKDCFIAHEGVVARVNIFWQIQSGLGSERLMLGVQWGGRRKAERFSSVTRYCFWGWGTIVDVKGRGDPGEANSASWSFSH